MHTALTETAAPAVKTTPQEKLRRFINAYWLRPENAFWMTLRSHALDGVEMRSPFLDLSCGDGVFSFLHAGGRFEPHFDVFGAVARLDEVESEHADIFDHVDNDYHPPIATPPAARFDCGTDCKKALLVKASRLNIYDRLILHDNNNALPFDDDTFQTVYCNAAYWIHNIDGFLTEMRRITATGGVVVLQVKLDTIREYTLDRHQEQLGKRWLETIDRGRIASWPTLAGCAEWEGRFARAGFDIVGETPFVTGTHAHIWDIGLRPIAPMLVKTMAAIHPHLRREIKQDWVNQFCTLLEPFCKPDMDLFTLPSHPVEIQYELTPKR